MKLLFITQKADKNGDILGVYHKWMEKLAEKLGGLLVICLYKGLVELPAAAKVLSLGKEDGPSKIRYVRNLFKYLFRHDASYDIVFVHMNPEYVLLAGWWWKLRGKKIVFWYNHPLGGLKAGIAVWLADKILYTSPFSYAAKFEKSVKMPVGIDVKTMRRDPKIEKKENSILYLGRISPIKNIDVLIKAAAAIKERGVSFHLTIVGNSTPGKPSEMEYHRQIRRLAEELDLADKVTFEPAVPHTKAAATYNSHEVFVNLTGSGSFDKTTLEAMACETPVMVSNKSFNELLPKKLEELCVFKERDSYDLVKRLTNFLNLPRAQKIQIGQELRRLVVERHSLDKLICDIQATLSNF